MKKERRFFRFAKAALEEYREKDIRAKDIMDIIDIRQILVQYGDSAMNEKRFLFGLRIRNLERNLRKVMYKQTF